MKGERQRPSIAKETQWFLMYSLHLFVRRLLARQLYIQTFIKKQIITPSYKNKS